MTQQPEQPEQPAPAITYADAGVDTAAGDRAVALMKDAVASTMTPAVVGGVGLVAFVLVPAARAPVEAEPDRRHPGGGHRLGPVRGRRDRLTRGPGRRR